MKKILFSCFALCMSFYCISADLVVRENGLGGAYSNITDAINAATAGDRIIIQPKAGGAPYVEALYINKSLQFLCETEGEKFNVTGNVSITPSTPVTVTIIGMKQTGSISATANAPAASRSIVKIMYCEITGSINFAYNNYDVSIINNAVTNGTVQFRAGKMIGNTIYYVSGSTYAVSVEPETTSLAPALSDTICIIANTITGTGSSTYTVVNLASTNYYYYVSNNFIKHGYRGIYVGAWKSGTTGTNEFINNTIYQYTTFSVSDYGMYFYNIPAGAKLKVYNNLLYGVANGSYSDYGIYGNTMGSGLVNVGYNHFNSGFDASYFVYGINDDGTNVLNSSFSVDNATGLATGSIVNAGHPDEIYYDIDLTRNDVGCYGGSFTFNNFTLAGEISGRVYYIEMPRRVISGNAIRIKAESYDK